MTAQIAAVEWSTEDNSQIRVELADGTVVSTPWPSTVWYARHVQRWLDSGNSFAPYIPPTPISDSDLVDRLLSSDYSKGLAGVLFEYENRVRVLEGKPTVTIQQYRPALRQAFIEAIS